MTILIRSLMEPIVAEEAEVPLVLRITTPSVPRGQESVGGPMANPMKVRTYVLLDALPKELAERVRTATEALSW